LHPSLPHAKRKAGKGGVFAGKENLAVRRSPARFLHIGSLRTFRPLHNLKLDSLSFLQSAVAVANDSGIMNENIRTIVAPDKAIAFRVIKPLYCAKQFGVLPTLTDFFPAMARVQLHADLDQKLRGV
jgi:hypothetical protein